MGQLYKVGQLAAATGLTVRTLHHYDHIGLVCPSRRTASGHRLYDEPDVQRLYEVLALRQLGLALDDIGAALSGTSSLSELLTRHREHLDRQLVALRTLRAQLATMLSTLETTEVTDFLALIREVVTVDETVKRYFNDTQLAQLAERREQLGEQAIADAEQSWQTLIPRVDQALESGMDPTSPEARELARQWMGLLESFHGGDDGLRDSLYRMHTDNAERIQQEFCGPTPQQIEFITRANAARS
ncbi:MAG TPA: MerR family transcriptional regulator [Mycobacteriales bacterium]|nr:MerR family transcriptional regulator [Mycobacteriales bacterium]